MMLMLAERWNARVWRCILGAAGTGGELTRVVLRGVCGGCWPSTGCGREGLLIAECWGGVVACFMPVLRAEDRSLESVRRRFVTQ